MAPFKSDRTGYVSSTTTAEQARLEDTITLRQTTKKTTDLLYIRLSTDTPTNELYHYTFFFLYTTTDHPFLHTIFIYEFLYKKILQMMIENRKKKKKKKPPFLF